MTAIIFTLKIFFDFQVFWKTPKAPQYLPKEIYKKKYHFDTARPWTAEFKLMNEPGTHKAKVFVEPVGEWRFFKGDRVTKYNQYLQ